MDLHQKYPACLCCVHRSWNFITFLCSVPFDVFVVVVVIMFICSCHYKYTSFTLVPFLCMIQWCDNNNHDLPQYVRQLMNWRDCVDWNKCRSIIISFIPVTDTVYMCTCHYMLLPFLLLHAARFWISQYCDIQIGYFYCWSKSHCWKYIFGLANQKEISNPI